MRRFASLAALTAASALALAGCAGPGAGAPGVTAPASSPSAPVTGALLGAGSSAQQGAIGAWSARLTAAHPDAHATFDARDSGSGRQAFREGRASFAGSDVPFTTEEVTAGGFAACAKGSETVEIPAYVSPIAIVFTLRGVDSLKLDPTTIAGIFTGAITRWDDPAIVATNPKAKLPATPITPVHRSDASGTTANFTDYLDQTAPDVWTAGSVDSWPAGLRGEPAEKSSGIALAVRGGEGRIGYVDASAAEGLSSVMIRVGDDWVKPSAQGASAALDAARIEQGRAPGDLATRIDRGTTAEGAYPVLLIGYLIGCTRYEKPATAALVKAFFSIAVSNEGQKAAAAATGSAPISDELRTKAQFAIDLIG